MAHARLEPGFCGAHVMKRRKSRAKRLPPPARHLKRLSRDKRCRAPFIKRSRSPGPLFSIADTSSRHSKAEIDERDVDKVSIGQKVVIRADALEGKWLNGSVVRISAMMGRKSISTGDPSDKSDRDILEAVIGLEDNTRSLPIGLRVTVQFLTVDSFKK